MFKLEDNCNKEIFIVYDGEQSDLDSAIEIYITSDFTKLIKYIKNLVPNLDFGIKVLHGILTKAYTLPKNLRGKKAFIIVNDAYNINSVTTIEESDAQSDEDLANAIDVALTTYTVDYITSAEIENVYILYGYELPIVMAIDEEELDEEIINTCQKVANDVKQIELLSRNETNLNGDTN